MSLDEQVTFGGGGLDRAAQVRGQRDEQARMLADPATRILPLWQLRPLLRGEDRVELAPVAPGAEVLLHASRSPIFLGLDEGVAWFAADVSAWQPEDQAAPGDDFADATEQRHPSLPSDHRFAELRSVMARLDPREAELVATARGLFAWHGNHSFCARCGAATEEAEAGWQRHCPACGAMHFPRTDPVVIMLITHGNSVLMGRAPSWGEGFFSLLAGFVEPGETVEAAVRREVWEETGVRVGPVRYLASQPWPFPASLMLGFQGEAETTEITVDPKEIAEAMWVSREEMMTIFAGDHPKIRAARPGAIARFILQNWLADRMG
ncbi:NAD(+) diphosphatase [Tropicimonas sp. IMCC34043]|uniref:NAD(+) diphosphatase n=1 Tax=Tropicimonas sp. IMCC34043 TaxID=2248760 RepID=UPI000E226913|nr:NAD(+) diphosphatase [Tropicimonas sp. IMCC34043]